MSLVDYTDSPKIRDMVELRTRERYEGSLFEFVRDAWPWIDSSQFKSNWAIEAFCDHLEMVTYGHIKRLIANYPPRCSKTNIVSVCWPAWTWARGEEVKNFTSGPQVRFLCASYNDRLALLAANKTRRLLLSPFYQRFWGSRFSLQWDQNTKTQFDNTQGGSRIATSVRGGLLGLGGDIINVDDPHNTETEKVIESDADRKRVESWAQELFSTRLNDPKQSAIVLTMQRLHEGDLTGVQLDLMEKGGEDWVHLMIPMRYEESRHCVTVPLIQYTDAPTWEDPRGEIAIEEGRDGQLMWEERFGEAEVANLEHHLGPYMASGRLQQNPVPKGGGILVRDWWKPWDEQEAMRYGLTWSPSPTGLKEFPQMELVWGSLDTAFKEKEENDFSALTIWGLWMDMTRTPRLMLMYGWAKRLKLHGPVIDQRPGEAAVNYKQRQQAQWGLIEHIADSMKRYKATRLLIEDKARGYDVAQEINRLHAREKWDVQLLEPVGDKVSRGHAVVPCFTDGAIWAPFLKGFPVTWAEPIIKQCAAFPKDTHDDLYDTVTQSINWARTNGLILRGDEVTAALEDESRYIAHQPSVAEAYGLG